MSDPAPSSPCTGGGHRRTGHRDPGGGPDMTVAPLESSTPRAAHWKPRIEEHVMEYERIREIAVRLGEIP
ncbi:hypothetical protein ACFV5N_17005 [Streptomyces sp. NPDC059853]|uniref:hypothetical protein n=1 Tax=Streptomyces sp. NPDC059853 TaxID=3346973 RepID=UPI00364D1785